MYRGGSPSNLVYPPNKNRAHVRTCLPHMERWTSPSKAVHHMPPRGPKPCFWLDSRSLQVDRFTTSTAKPRRSEVVGAAAWPRRSARIGLLQADLMQVHSPQSHLTPILNRHGRYDAGTRRYTTRVDPTPGERWHTARVDPTPGDRMGRGSGLH